MKNLKIESLIFGSLLVFGACTKEPAPTTADTLSGNNSVANRTDCGQGTLMNPNTYQISGGGNVDVTQFDYQHYSDRISEGQCGGTYGPITWTTDDDCKVISWTWTGEGSPCGVVVIAKGGNASNVYVYEDGCTSGSGLVSPTNASGGPAGLSNITFGWNECAGTPGTPGTIVCQYETGWGGMYAGEGKAWWYYFDTQGAWTQPIYAGQTLTDGTITYDGSNFHIDLGSWELDSNSYESVKAQGYNVLPKKRPAPGQFTMYKDTSLTFPANGSRYYAIHLDLQQCE